MCITHIEQARGSWPTSSQYGWLALPGDEEWQKLGVTANPKSLIDKLGSEGWEMVGGPLSQNAVFTYKAANGTWHDRSYWVTRDYWFKRPAE